MFDVDVGIPASAEQVQGVASPPSVFPLPLIMVVFLALGYVMLRQVWKE